MWVVSRKLTTVWDTAAAPFVATKPDQWLDHWIFAARRPMVDCVWRAGRKLEAHFQWNHARDLDPEPADLEKIVKKLESGLAANDSGRDG